MLGLLQGLALFRHRFGDFGALFPVGLNRYSPSKTPTSVVDFSMQPAFFRRRVSRDTA